jgi:hypothetical protein
VKIKSKKVFFSPTRMVSIFCPLPISKLVRKCYCHFYSEIFSQGYTKQKGKKENLRPKKVIRKRGKEKGQDIISKKGLSINHFSICVYLWHQPTNFGKGKKG